MNPPRLKIAIDGFSSCGKSTLARQLSRKLGYIYIDSGAMYRAITLYFLRHAVDLHQTADVADALSRIHITVVPRPGQPDEIFLNDEDVTYLIRQMLVAEKVSEVAALKAVREFAVAQQKVLARGGGVVMDGRDIGTVVFPDAELKIFMTAAPAERVRRRFAELQTQNPVITMEEVQHNLEHRDHIDSTREESPLRQAADALVLDNTYLTETEQLELALQWYEAALRRKTEALVS